MPKSKSKAELTKQRNRATAATANAKKKAAKLATKNARELAEQGKHHIRQQCPHACVTVLAVVQARTRHRPQYMAFST